MFKKENAVINENQDDKAHFLADLIILYFKNVDSENDSDVEKIKNE